MVSGTAEAFSGAGLIECSSLLSTMSILSPAILVDRGDGGIAKGWAGLGMESGSSNKTAAGEMARDEGDAVEFALSPVGIWRMWFFGRALGRESFQFFFHWQAGKVGKTWDPGASPVWAAHVKPRGGPLPTT